MAKFGCGTIYKWGLTRKHLQGDKSQMVHISDKIITLNNQEQAFIRSAKPKDARSFARFKKEMLRTSDHLNTRSEEAYFGTWHERKSIKRILSKDDEIILLAIKGGEIIGAIETLTDRRIQLKHSTVLGISIAAPHRGLGVGRQLLEVYLAWAKEHPRLERIELHVHADNTVALELYKKLGFQHEGQRIGAIRRGSQEYVDDILMCFYLGHKSTS